MTIAQSKASSRDLRRVGEVADDRRLGIALGRHEDVDPLDVPSEPGRVVRRRDLEDPPADVRGVRADEALDVDAVDRRSALEAPVRVDRRHASQVAELRRTRAGASRRRPAGGAQPATDARRNESSPAGQGRDHRPSWRPTSPSSSSRRTRTTACSRSARRWRVGTRGRRVELLTCSRSTPSRRADRGLGSSRRVRDRGGGGACSARRRTAARAPCSG